MIFYFKAGTKAKWVVGVVALDGMAAGVAALDGMAAGVVTGMNANESIIF